MHSHQEFKNKLMNLITYKYIALIGGRIISQGYYLVLLRDIS